MYVSKFKLQPLFIYLITFQYYLYQRKTLCKNTLVTQSLCVLLSGYCAVSRLSDHRHHWWDVVAGFVIAIVVLIYTVSIPSINV